MNVSTKNVGDVDTFRGVLANHCLNLFLVSSIDLMAVNTKECLIMDREHYLVSVEVIKTQAFVISGVK